jgi:Na+-translocating ferredoxin:NAD+ oxidoreductase RnfC subunit
MRPMTPAAKLPPALFVPLPSSQAHLPIGTRVRRGQCLIQSTLGANFIPIAPADGTIAALTEVELIANAPSPDRSPSPAAQPPDDLSPSSTAPGPDHFSPSPGTPGEGWGGGRPTLTPALQINLDPSDIAEPTELNAQTPPASQANSAADLPHLIDKLRLAGVRAQRQTCPDLLQQLHHAMQRPIDTVLCSLLDPSGGDSPLNSAVLQSAGDDLIAGLLALVKATGANRVCLVVPPNLVRRAAARARTSPASSIKIIPLANDYPQADPTLLIYALFGRRLRPDQLPPAVSCIMVDGMASVAIGRALRDEPMTRTIVQVRDSARGQTHLFWTLIGTPLHHLLEAAQIPEPDRRTLRAGSALRDLRLCSENAIIDGHELSIDCSAQAPAINPDPCIRCGWCVEACPVRIHPAALLQAAQDNDKPMASRFGLHACIQCGICNYVCPSRLPLLQGIRSL